MTTAATIDKGDLADIFTALDRFITVKVEPLHNEYSQLIDNPRRRFDDRGVDRPEVIELIKQVRTASANAGFYTMTIPNSMGGAGIGNLGMFLVWEYLFRRCNTRLWLGHHALAHWTKGPSPLLEELAPEVRDQYLPQLMSGSSSMCFAMSEPDAGSDSWMMRSRAARVPGGWVLNGAKQWISNGAHADVAVIFAVTDVEMAHARKGGIGAFLVPTSSNGFEFAGVTPMFGHAGSNEALLNLDDVFVPDDHVLGDPAQGFRLAMLGVTLGRIYNCGKATGLAEWALSLATDYSKERVSLGAPLASHQAISFAIADAATDLHAARLVAIDSMERLDRGEHARKELAMAKVLATEMAVRVIDRAMQIHGAMGFTNEVGLAEAWQMARVVCVADGSAEILRRQIAKEVLKGRGYE
jgi:acyl-CoA dehydrogenase